MSGIPAALRRLVKARADGCCEYCGLAQIGQEATFHIDHIQPVSAGGPTVAENLALACTSCSLLGAGYARNPKDFGNNDPPSFICGAVIFLSHIFL